MESPIQVRETAFEQRRGVNKVEVQSGYAQVHIGPLSEPIHEQRVAILEAIATSGTNIKFLKLTPTGLTFLAREVDLPQIQNALTGQPTQVVSGCSTVLVHAVNMRDEEGFIARMVAAAIGSGARMEHVGDMHDRLLFATASSDALTISQAIEKELEIEVVL